MKKTIAVSIFLALATMSAAAQSNTQKSFDLMKSLTGSWEGKSDMGEVKVAYRLTAGGSALMSEIQSQMDGKLEDMITMIHMDGSRLLLTHYCEAGNQPRMQASRSSDGRSITFDFVDATNLASAQPGHMRRVIFTFTDADHHTEEWHFAAPGKEMVRKFDLQRKS
jgi:hypothetical protein